MFILCALVATVFSSSCDDEKREADTVDVTDSAGDLEGFGEAEVDVDVGAESVEPLFRCELEQARSLEATPDMIQRWPSIVLNPDQSSYTACWKDQTGPMQEESRLMDVSWNESVRLVDGADYTSLITTSSGYASAWTSVGNAGIFGALFDESGTRQSPILQIDTSGYDDCRNPTITDFGDDYYAAWNCDSEEDSPDIIFTIIDSSFATYSILENVTQHGASSGPIIINADGQALLVYRHFPPGNYFLPGGLKMARIDAQHQLVDEVEVQPLVENFKVEGVQAIYTGNAIAIAWALQLGMGGPSKIYFARFDATGQLLTGPVLVAESETSFISPRTYLAFDGSVFLLAYNDDRECTQSGARLWAVIIDVDGQPLIEPFIMGGLPDSNVSEAAIIAGAAGEFGILWFDARDDPIGHDPWFATLVCSY